jgi:phage tail sheath protein FI
VTTPTYPGVYVIELPSSQHPITGVSTSMTAFVGSAIQGPVNNPQVLFSWSDFVRTFGGLWANSTMSYAVYQFFQNGGATAVVVRVAADDAKAAELDLGSGVKLQAANPGNWGNSLLATVTNDQNDNKLWGLTIQNSATGATEQYFSISTDTTSPISLTNALQQSLLVQVAAGSALDQRPAPATNTAASGGADGAAIGDAQIDPESHTGGIYALLATDIFNILCLPPPARGGDLAQNTLDDAAQLCVQRRAMLIVDPPSGWTSVQAAVTGMATPLISGSTSVSGSSIPNAANAAMYFPRITVTDPLTGNPASFVSCGAVAGIWASTDSQRGVWKAPAGTNATLAGGTSLPVLMTDDQNGELNPLGLNCLRNFPIIGPVVWGARTLRGADVLEDQWKYISIRRTALFIEESLRRGTQWVVFEPNAEPLWSSIRLNVGAFMAGLYRQGAFAGPTPNQAYLVKCDSENNPPSQVQLGIVNILVGFAPLYPAEFVFISIEQLAGQS